MRPGGRRGAWSETAAGEPLHDPVLGAARAGEDDVPVLDDVDAEVLRVRRARGEQRRVQFARQSLYGRFDTAVLSARRKQRFGGGSNGAQATAGRGRVLMDEMKEKDAHLRVAVDVADQNELLRAAVARVRVHREAPARVAGDRPGRVCAGRGSRWQLCGANGVGPEAAQERGPKRCGHGEPERGFGWGKLRTGEQASALL